MAENIAVGYADAEEVMNGWLCSPGHYANIMRENLKNLGVGSFTDSEGTRYWVQCFDGSEEHEPAEIKNKQVVRSILRRLSYIELDTAGRKVFPAGARIRARR